MPNALIHEQSPYLLQHAHNPVDWHPWGEAAFAKAKAANKPVLISIGYSACHWCHVMERESFEDAETAAFMNEYFINIKVDREEYPDVDDFFMTAVQTLSGNGGWPLNVFATPDKLPFYGGTYFPPLPAYGRPSWRQLLQRMAEVWLSQQDTVQQQARQMLDHLQNAARLAIETTDVVWNADAARHCCEAMMRQADREYGGFGSAPKFPSSMSIAYLLRYYHFYKDSSALAHARLSLDRMISGGLYDQVGGGFARYAVDAAWLVPHFEKMLYDNAMLVSVLCDAYQLIPDENYRKTIESTLHFVLRELKQQDAGFYSALDADSEGIEGKFYTWDYADWKKEMAAYPPYVTAYFGVTEEGNWEHTNILHRAALPDALALKYNADVSVVRKDIGQASNQLFLVREERIRPSTDDKILLSWNALMNAALSKAACVLDNPDFLQQAEEHMQWMLSAFDTECEPKHVWKSSKARILANLDDLANLIHALVQLAMYTNTESYLHRALSLTKYVLEHFSIPDKPMFYFTSDRQNEIPVRKPEIYDGVTPSSNAVMAENLYRLGILTANNTWIDQAEQMILLMKNNAMRYPTSFAYWGTLGLYMDRGFKTVIITGENSEEEISRLRKNFLPNCFYFFEKKENFVTMPFRKPFAKRTQIFICTKNTCLPPITHLPENTDFAIL